jgi:hypothetical protein
MNNFSVREYTMSAPAQLLRNWLETRPNNQGDLDSIVTGGGWEGLLHGVDLLLFQFLNRSTVIVVGLRFKWCTLYKQMAEWLAAQAIVNRVEANTDCQIGVHLNRNLFL